MITGYYDDSQSQYVYSIAQHYASTEFVLSRDLLSNAGRTVGVAENIQVIKFSKIKAS